MEHETIKILLAEDDADDRDIFREVLAESSPKSICYLANDGQKLLQHLNDEGKEVPDIIFLDINMPCMNGKECLVEIRKNKEFDHIPVVMISTSLAQGDIEETFANGANLYLIKPYFFNDFIKVLKTIFVEGWQKNLIQTNHDKFVMRMG